MNRFLEWLIRFFPKTFRERYGEEVVEFLRLRSRHVRERDGLAGVLRFWFYNLDDLLRSAWAERRTEWSSSSFNDGHSRETMMGTLGQDVRYALRTLAHNRGFTAVVVLTLALGIGSNTAIFSVVNGVLLRPPPFGDPDRIVMVHQSTATIPYGVTSPANFLDWVERNRVFESIAAIRFRSYNLTGSGEPEKIMARSVSPPFFSVMGVKPLLGRGFAPGDDIPGNHQVVVLAHGLWQRRFGSDLEIVGKTVRLDGSPYTVVGVMPLGFHYPSNTPLWTPMVLTAEERERRTSWFLRVVARLDASTTLDGAQARMTELARQMALEYPDANEGRGIGLEPIQSGQVREVRSNLWMLLGAVGFVLLIACTNVANLWLARGAVREKEISIRAVLGASRLRLVRQVLTESVLLGMVGGAAGLLLAWSGVRLFIALSPAYFPRLDEISVDPKVLAYTFGLSFLTGLLFGLVPALQTSATDLSDAIKQGSRSGSGFALPHRRRLQGVLIGGEVALALVLLVGAGLLTRSFFRLLAEDPGFRTEQLLAADIELPSYKYPDGVQQLQFFETLVERVAALPGAQAVAVVNALPFSDLWYEMGVSLEDRDEQGERLTGSARYGVVSPGYFRTLGIPVKQGRVFTAEDRAGASGVVIVNQAFADEYFRDRDPVGKQIAVWARPAEWRTIIGVVGNVKHMGLDDQAYPQVYRVLPQSPMPYMLIVIRTQGDPVSLTSAVRGAVLAIDADQPISRISTVDGLISDTLAQPRLYLVLLSIFAGVAIVLAAVGVYGVIAYSVSQRTHEIGLRLALGARGDDVLRLVVRQGMRLTLPGVVVGLAGAYALTRYLRGLLYEIAPTDLLTYAGITVFISAVALLACYIPARRSARVDPMVALRVE